MSLSQRELDQARLELLRQRVSVFGTVTGVLLVVFAGLQWWIGSVVLSQTVSQPSRVGIVAGLLMGVVLVVMPRVRTRRDRNTTLRRLVWRTIRIVTVSVLIQTFGAKVLAAGISETLRPLGFEGTLGPIFVLWVWMIVLHTAAAIIVPWTVLEACVPPAAWVAVTVLSSIGVQESNEAIMLATAMTGFAGLPGVLIAFFRSGGLREKLGLRLIGERYAEVERELTYARRLHERLFPKPLRDGPIRMEYAYEPMRQIGGDFLDISAPSPSDGSRLVVMIDVTGHGVTAALAVNRLHGELKRLVAEASDQTPGVIMTALNRYVHLTLADESIFATAAAMRLWPTGTARLCVAGHPPPLVRSADGTVTAIDTTAPMLGPFASDEFQADEVEMQLTPGAVLMLYTDGAVECQNARGRELGQPAMEQIVAKIAVMEQLPSYVMAEVTRYRAGAATDDVLIAALSVVR